VCRPFFVEDEHQAEIRTARDAAEAALADLRRAQDRLIQSEKMASLGQLIAGIAHEIKNPLNFVNNFAGLSVELLDELKETAAPAIAGLAEDTTIGSWSVLRRASSHRQWRRRNQEPHGCLGVGSSSTPTSVIASPCMSRTINSTATKRVRSPIDGRPSNLLARYSANVGARSVSAAGSIEMGDRDGTCRSPSEQSN
jgi:hypothetical protein